MSLDLQKSSRNVLSLRREARELCRSRNPVISEMLGGRGWATTSQCAGHWKKKLSPAMMMNRDYGLGWLKGKTQVHEICLLSVRKKEWCFQTDSASSMPDDFAQ